MNYLTFLFSLANAASCLGIGFFVFSRHAGGIANRLFLVVMTGAAFTEALWAGAAHLGLDSPFFQRLGASLLAVTMAAAVYFSASLGRRRESPARRTKLFPMAFIILPAAAIAFIVTAPEILKAAQVNGETRLLFSPAMRWFFGYLSLCLILVVYNMDALFRSSSSSGRWRVKYAVLGISATSLFFLAEIGYGLATLSLRSEFIAVNSMIFLMAQALFLFAVLRHRLLDVNVFISREVTFRALLTTTAMAYFILIGVLGYLTKSWGGPYGVITAAAGVFALAVGGAVVLLSGHVQASLRQYINTHFYRNKYEYRSRWNSFSRRISRSDDLPGLSRLILLEILETLWVGAGTLWILDEETNDFSCIAVENIRNPEKRLDRENRLIASLMLTDGPVASESLMVGGEIGPAEKDLLVEIGAAIISPLRLRGKMIGFLTLGPNLLRQPFEYEDREMLATLSAQAAVALYHMLVSEQLSAARGLESLTRLSAFIIHDLKNAVSMLNMVVQNAAANMHKPEFQQDAIMTVSRSMDKIKRLVEQLSFPNTGTVGPRFTGIDLNALLDEVVDRLQIVHLPGVRLKRDYGTIPTMQADPDMLARLFDNLLVNAVQSLPAEGGEIRLVTKWREDGSVLADVADNGCGMDRETIEKHLFRPFHTTKKKGLGLGLYQCKGIVAAHRGTIRVESAPGKGTTFRVAFSPQAVIENAPPKTAVLNGDSSGLRYE